MQACGKAYCKNCTKVHIEDTTEGKKCYNNCSSQSHVDRYLGALHILY
jgi:hypothetical protein